MQFLKSCVCLCLMLAVCSGVSADETQPKSESGKGKKDAQKAAGKTAESTW